MVTVPNSVAKARKEHRQPQGELESHCADKRRDRSSFGSGAKDRPGAHEWTVWEGQADNKAEALQRAEEADSRVDLV
jgi:hypothetical protein